MRRRTEQGDGVEGQIEEVLGRLTAVAPSAGFEARLAEALRARAVDAGSTAQGGWFSGLWPWPRGRWDRGVVGWVAAMAACGVVVLAGVVLAVVVLGHQSGLVARRGGVQGIGAGRREPARQAGVSHAASGLRADPLQEMTAVPVRKVEVLRPRQTAARPRPPGETYGPFVTARLLLSVDADQAAMVDWHTPSFPAPPLPLTAQERRVRLMLRRGEKQDLAQLDPVQSAMFVAQEQAALHEFFEPPVIETIQGDPQ